VERRIGQIHIDGSRVDTAMSEKGLESEYIPIVFVEMSGEGMAKTMAGKTVRPAKLLFRQTDMTTDILGAGSSGGIPAGREEISHGPAVNAPVMSERVQRKGRERDIAVRTVLGSGDMDLHVCPADILIAKAKDFTDTKTAAVHQNDHDFRFQIIDRIDEISDFIAGGDKWDILIELPERKLRRIPWLVKDVDGEEAKLRNDGIDGTIGEVTIPLDPVDEIPLLLPCDLRRAFTETFRDVVEVCGHISCVGFYRILRETAKCDHILITFKIIHKGFLLKNKVIAVIDAEHSVTEGPRKKKEYC